MSSGIVNQEAKKIFAKLLATEDIMVRHDSSSITASFDVDKRVLTLPVLNGMDSDIYDLFVGHEVGHALFTPNMSEEDMLSIMNDVCKENIILAKHILNMVEDARIERMMRSKYPGIGKNFVRGYTNLLKNDFFGESVANFAETNIIDRLNLWYKLGIYGILNLNMNEIENDFIQMMDSAKTFEDVVNISKKIVEHLRESGDEHNLLPKEDETENVIEISVKVKGEDKEEGESNNSQESIDPEKEEDENAEENAEVVENKSETATGDIAGISFSTKKNTKPGKISSGDALKNYIEKNAQTSSGDSFLYNALPSPDLSKIIVPWQDIQEDIQRIYAEHVEYDEGSIYYNPGPTYWSPLVAYDIDHIFKEFDRECRASISGMTTAFKRKQQAYISRRTSVGKTGRIDMNAIHRFKFDDDLFLRSTFVPKGKNHGMILYIDWSGSMSGNIRQTLEQAIYLAYFCRSINIPFRVYAFSDHPFLPYEKNENYRSHRSDGFSFWKEQGRDKHGNVYAKPYNFHLFEFFSNEMNNNQFANAVKNILYISDMNSGKFRFYTRHSFTLGGTPLNESILTAISLTRQFRNRYNIQIMNSIFLTDGESGGRLVQYEPTKNYHYPSYHSKTNVSFLFEGKTYDINNGVTNTLLQILKEEANTRTIGFFLCSSRHLEYSSFCTHDNRQKKIQEFRKNSFVLCDHPAYDNFYMMMSHAGITTMDSIFDSIDQNSDTRKIINTFIKSANSRNKGRILLNNFAETVAQDFN